MKPFDRSRLGQLNDGDRVSLILVNGDQYNGNYVYIDDDHGVQVNLRSFANSNSLLIGIPIHAIYGFFQEIVAPTDVLDADILSESEAENV